MQKHKLLLAIAPVMFVAACGGTPNRGLESANQPVVSRTDFAFDVGVGQAGLSPGEAVRLGQWMGSLRIGYGDKVAVDDPNHDPSVRAEVAAAAARFGLLLAKEAPMTAAPIAPGTARIVVSRARASVPGCPDHSRMYQPDYEGHTSSNFGCGVNSNLAAMVADPADLVRGDAGSGIYDPAVGTRAIDRFRKADTTGAGGTAVRSESTAGAR